MRSRFLIVSVLFLISTTSLLSQKYDSIPEITVKNSPNVVTSLSSTKPDVNASHQRTGTDFSILIPPGEALIFKYNNSNSGLEQYIFPTYQNLTSTSIQAIDKSPEWLQNDLRVVLTQLSSGIQDKWANAIINAQDPYVDEIAFAISALSPEYLSSTYAYTEMLDINAEYIYKYDSLFNYVEIVDYGTSADEDYYTTASYKIVNGANDTVNIEIPKETYYWYVVHPQINSEIPAFVKPDQHESSATIGLTNPQNGVFWRTYMFEHNDTDIPNGDFGSYTSSVNANALITADDNGVDSTEFETLAQTILDSLQNIEIYWDSIPLGVASPYMMESYYPQNALALINRYAWSCGRFWSVGAVERPHQPVRILKWGIGRCGEYEDLTVALGRTALIPVTGIEGLSSDHVFNCFYDPLTQASNTDYNIDNWKVWETTITGFVNSYINHDGNGGRWASLNFMRSDGFTYPIIEQFSNGTGTLTINVRDEYAKPIDGAHVVIAAKSSTTTDIYLDNAGTTDQNGQVIFRVGDQRVYYAKVFAEGQETPTGNSVSGVSNNQEVQDGQNYSSTFTFYNLNIEYPSYSNNDSIFQGTAGNKLVIDLSSAKELIVGKSMSNDLSSTFWYANQIRQYRNTSPEFSVFQVDQYNAIQYLTGGNFDAMNFSTQNNFSDTIEMPNDDLYFVIRNNNHNNYIQLDGNISVEDAGNNTISTLEPNVEGGSVLGITTVNKINSNEIKIYPNPANKHLIVEAENMHELTLYNIAGMLIYSSKTNSSKTVIDLKDFAKGVYIIKITSDDNIYSEKIIISN